MNWREKAKAESVARKLVLAVDALQSLESFEMREIALNLAIVKMNGAGYSISAETFEKLRETL